MSTINQSQVCGVTGDQLCPLHFVLIWFCLLVSYCGYNKSPQTWRFKTTLLLSYSTEEQMSKAAGLCYFWKL